MDGKVDPEFRKESIVLLKESQLVQKESERLCGTDMNEAVI